MTTGIKKVRLTVLGGVAIAAIGLGTMTASVAGSHGDGGITVNDARHKAMHTIADSMKALGAVAKGEAGVDAATVVHAQTIQALAGTVKFLFPEGSITEKSRAKPEIWTRWSEFEKAADNFTMASAGLVEAAQSGDPGKIGAALGTVGKTCGDCHKPFRAPKK